MIDPQQPDYTSTPASDHRAPFDYQPVDARRDPVVTIVTPFFNTGALFHETARSVVRQSLQQWEWLIVNDGSTLPDSLAVLEQYRKRDHRIRVIDLPVNGGPSRARNAGYAEARAPYVLQLDSDNLLEPTAAEKWWWYLETHPRASFVKGFSVGFGAQTYLWRSGFHNPDAFLDENPVDATSLVRVRTHRRAGGYDESMRSGLEDWDFWMRCAEAGEWGATVPEFLDWYRRRTNHNDRWERWDAGPKQRAFVKALPSRFPGVRRGRFPRVSNDVTANVTPELQAPAVNLLARSARRLLMVVPWFAMGGSDKFNLDLVEQFRRRGWEVTLAATSQDSSWLPQFARLTPDVFVLPAFLETADYPRFLHYLIESRRPDVVLVSHSELGYHLLPYLRAHAPDAAFVDYCHVVEENWLDGGYPRLSVQYRHSLDLTIASSAHLQRWMLAAGAEADRMVVCYTGGRVRSDDELLSMRHAMRTELGCADDARLVLYPARLCAQKQPAVFAETMRVLRDGDVRVTAVVAGDGPEQAWLGAFLKRHRLGDRVRLIGPVAPQRMPALMAAADLCFLPSTHEGVALTLFEAMSHGAVFVGADVGGQREVATDDCAVLLPRAVSSGEEASAYAAAMASLLRSPETLRRMASSARRRVAERFSIEQMADGMEEALRRAIELRAARPRPAVPSAVADLMAARAIEYDRVARLAEHLWVRSAGAPAVTKGGGWRMWVFRQCAWLEPAYAWGLRRGWHWLPTLRERIRAALVS